MDQDVSRDLWGTAAPANPIAIFHVFGDRAYFVTRNVDPTIIGVLDIDAGEVVDHYEIPRGDGAWSMVIFDGDVYVGTYGDGDVYRLDTNRGELSHLVELPDDTHVCDMAVEDGKIYAGGYPTTNVYEIGPETGDLREYGPACPGEQYARAIAADGDDVFVGIGSHAHLIRLDRHSGDRDDILPEVLADEGFVREPAVTGDMLVYRTGASGHLVLADRDDPGDYRIARPTEGARVGEYLVEDGVIYLLATDDERRLYRYHVAEDAFDDLGPAPGAPVDLFRRGTEFMGARKDSIIWTYDYETRDTTRTTLAEAGSPPGAEIPFSLAVLEGTPVVAGHRRLHVHDRPDSDSIAAVEAPGEAKAMTVVDDRLWLAFYPNAILASYTRDDAEVSELCRIGHEQNRPRAIHSHDATGRVFVGTMPEYGHLGGALAAYNPDTGDLRVERNVVPDQSITSFASTDGTLFFGSEIWGGNGIDPTAAEARLVARGLDEDERRWKTTPVSGAERVTHLALAGDWLVGAASTGDLFTVNPGNGEVRRRKRVADEDDFWRPGEQLVAHRGDVYCLTDDDLLRIDPATLASERVATGLDPAVPMLAAEPDGTAYTLENRDLVALSLS